MHTGVWHAVVVAVMVAPVLLRGHQQLAREVTGGAWVHVVGAGDTLRSIAARYGIDVEVITRENTLGRNATLLAGTTLALNNRHIASTPADGETLIVNVPQRMLFYFEHGMVVRAFPVAVGRRDWPTPLGAFSVVVAEASPTWDVPVSIQEDMRRNGLPVVERVPPGPKNPLGSHWLGLSMPGIGIHGTPHPPTLYAASTHGCIRLHPDDVAFVFAHVPPGATGRFIYEPILLAEADDAILLEAHPDIYQRSRDPERAGLHALEAEGAHIDWHAVEGVLALREGIARKVGRR